MTAQMALLNGSNKLGEETYKEKNTHFLKLTTNRQRKAWLVKNEPWAIVTKNFKKAYEKDGLLREVRHLYLI